MDPLYPLPSWMALSLRQRSPVTPQGSAQTQLAVQSMESGDTVRAIASARDLAAALWERKLGEAAADGLQAAFHALLHRRGYFVSTPAALATTLGEIRVLGEGFDLYDLARQLAALDTVATECLHLARQPLFPELRAFAPRCPCGQHPLTSL